MTKEERLEYNRKYHIEHKEEIRKRKKIYYQTHKSESLAKSKLWREANPDKIKQYMIIYKDRKKVYSKKYREKNKSKISIYYSDWYKKNGRTRSLKELESIKIWRKMNPEKISAQRKLRQAVKNGIIKKPLECSICHKKVYLNAHHDDYTKPLNVRWVCAKCHKNIHTSA